MNAYRLLFVKREEEIDVKLKDINMKTDIIISGVGGQGILSIATVIGLAALKTDLYLKQSEVHGMSQRGGDVQSHLRISDHEISSDLIPEGEADIILSIEPMESLRYLPFLNQVGWLVTNSSPYINIPDYPDLNKLLSEIRKIKNHVVIDADEIAHQAGSVKSSNMVILGAASGFLNLDINNLIKGMEEIFAGKGKAIIDLNIRAFMAGKEEGEKYLSEIRSK